MVETVPWQPMRASKLNWMAPLSPVSHWSQGGLAAEALDHYQTAADLLRPVNDWLWLAGALEGPFCLRFSFAFFFHGLEQVERNLNATRSGLNSGHQLVRRLFCDQRDDQTFIVFDCVFFVETGSTSMIRTWIRINRKSTVLRRNCIGSWKNGEKFYWVLPNFTGFYLVLFGLNLFVKAATEFTGFYWVLPSFTGFYLVLFGLNLFDKAATEFTGFYWVLPSFTEFQRSSSRFHSVSLGFTKYYWDLLGFAMFYGVLPSMTCFNWVLFGFS